jgi:hypothetical protein
MNGRQRWFQPEGIPLPMRLKVPDGCGRVPAWEWGKAIG